MSILQGVLCEKYQLKNVSLDDLELGNILDKIRRGWGI